MVSEAANRPTWARRIAADRPKRLLLALLLAPVGAWAAGSLALVPYVAILRFTQGRAADVFDGVGSVLIGVLFLPLGLIVVVVVGLPAHILLVALKLRQAWAYGAAGFAAGLALSVWIASGDCGDSTRNLCIEDYGLADLLGLVMLGAVPGFGGALTFWAMVRPDREAAASSST